MVDTKYKLTYFPIMALAEPIRLLLCYGDCDFDDNRVNKDIWPKLKDSTPFGQVPILEFDGKVAHQSVAICRYLAKQCDLAGRDNLEDLEIDSIVDTIAELRAKIAVYNVEKVEERRKEILQNLETNVLPFYLSRFDKIVQANVGHLATDKMTWADVYFVGILDYCNGVLKQNIIEKYPNLVKLVESVRNMPAIGEWIQKRPESEY